MREVHVLATRIIPILLYRGTTLVKGKQFNSWRSIGHVVQAAEIYSTRDCDEIIFLDIGATPKGCGPDLKLVEQITAKCFSPVTIGGGVRSVQDVRDLLNAGADKVAICTAIATCAGILPACADIVGCQAIVAAVDYWPTDAGPCAMANACKTALANTLDDGAVLPKHPAEWAALCAEFGAGEILLTSGHREGMMGGYDLDLIRAVSQAVSVPVIAHGGCGSPEHMREAIEAGASAVAAGSLFAFTECRPADCAQYLAESGVEVRL